MKTPAALFSAFALLVSAVAVCLAQDEPAYPKKTYVTQRILSSPPELDGILDDACWEQVEWGEDFLEWEPTEGVEPSQRTSFKILYDEDNLYIAYRAHDTEPDRIEKQLARRDRFPGDWIEINIDSYFDRRTAYSFTSSVSGVRGDEYISRDGRRWDGNWDPVWQLATNIDDQGWTAEVRIPFNQLRFANKPDQVWGIQVQRRLFREEERSLWQPKSKEESGWVSRFGELHGINGIAPKKRLELLPYAAASGERYESQVDNPFADGQDGDWNFGLDGKFGVTSNLTMDFTINPDFGQVEADPSQLNLTAFETFFSERRPFFIEGRDILNFQLSPAITGGGFTSDNLFYSRRIGGRPQHYPDTADGEFVDQPINTDILGAFKITGKTGGGLSVGILESVTGREFALIQGNGADRREGVAPMTNYFVTRMQQEWNEGNTLLGGMVTSVNRRMEFDQLRFLPANAYSSGLDFKQSFDDRVLYVAATAAGSLVQGSSNAIDDLQTSSARYYQRPDNDYVDYDPDRTELSGYSGALRIGNTGGGPWDYEFGATVRSPGFEINDVGFMRRADQITQHGWVSYNLRNPFLFFRRAGFNFNQWNEFDYGRNFLGDTYNFNFNMRTVGNWGFGAGVTRGNQNVSNTELRGGPASVWPGYYNPNFWVNSDHRKSLSYGFGGSATLVDEDSRTRVSGWFDVTMRPSDSVRFSFSPGYTKNDSEMQYVQTSVFDDGTNAPADRYLFGTIDQETFDLTVRLDYSLTPNLSIQYYGSPFMTAGTYGRYKRITDPRAVSYGDRFHTFEEGEISYVADEEVYDIDENGDGTTNYSIENPDFDFVDFNSNLVVRWEYSPGSTLFFVWAQSRSSFTTQGRFELQQDVDRLFGVHPHNVIMVKFNKWFSL